MATRARKSNNRGSNAVIGSPTSANIQQNQSSKPSNSNKRVRASTGNTSSNRESTGGTSSKRASTGDEPSRRASTGDTSFRKPQASPMPSPSDTSFPPSPDNELLGQPDLEDEELSFVDEDEDENYMGSTRNQSTTSNVGSVIGFIKSINDLKIGQAAMDFLAAENGWRGALSKIRLKTSGIFVKHRNSVGKSFSVENQLNALLFGLFYLFATNFGIRTALDSVRDSK